MILDQDIIICFVLSQCGFFRRKQLKKDGDEVQNEDFEAFEKNPFNQQAKLPAVNRISENETTQVEPPTQD